MDTPHILQAIGMWGLLISMIVWIILGFIGLYHPRCKKEKALYYKFGAFFDIGGSILIFFAFLSEAPFFYADDVPLNIKIGLIFLGICAIGYGVWAASIQYRRYKRALWMKKEGLPEIGVKND